ncbi:hypothetical protein [Xanthomonas campestris]|uniref:Uncharacterized protein n=1 Tax=Xanthomonas campestris pv. papavericola TaxID=487881 RepID=A0AAJ2X6F0_XANCA|nr:hypothetical protein [Xanthomonas campestris]MEC3890276.1 hypothetical protein [Xanthomonas campestris pv. papavericola]
MNMHEPLRRISIQKTIIVSAIFLLFAGTNLAVAKPLNFVYQTTQMTSFTAGGPGRTEIFNQQWADGAAQCRDAFPQTTAVRLGRVNARAINARTYAVTGKWICKG